MSIDFITGGTPFPYKPAKMLGFYKYTSNVPIEDFGQARVILKKYNENTGKRDTIGLGENLLLNPAGDFMPFEVPINYLVPNVTPDSIVVIFHSTYPDFPNAGAELWLDSLSFDISTAIEEFENGGKAEGINYCSVSPNPSDEIIYVEFNFPADGFLKLFNSEGKLTYVESVASTFEDLEINVSGFPAGLYILQLFHRKGEVVQTHKIFIY